MLPTGVQIRLLDDQIDHFDGILLMRNKPLDGIINDGAFTRHQTLASTMSRGRKGFTLLDPNGQTRPLLGWTVVLGFAFPLVGCFEDHFGGRRRHLPLLFTSCS